MARPTVSVVMSAYNSAQFLPGTINSVLGQTYRDFEFIIVDDGSTDATPTVLAEAASRDARIRVVRRPHMGIPRSLNFGDGLASGEFIARQDADDVSYPERLARQVAFLQQHPHYAAVGTFAHSLDDYGRVTGHIAVPAEYVAQRDLDIPGRHLIHATLLLRSSALLAVGGYRLEFPVNEDIDLWLRLAERFTVGSIPEVLYGVRVSMGSTTGRHQPVMPHYAALAREFAVQRRTTGRDLLMGDTPPASGWTPYVPEAAASEQRPADALT
jgi:glycosyltransferase involved in cell wall biosynthesis